MKWLISFRFKQIKEEEERRKHEIEQQKRAAQGTVLSNERSGDDADSRSNSANGATDQHKYEFNIHAPSNGGVAVNGEMSNPDLKEDQKELYPQLESKDSSLSHEAQEAIDRNQS